MQTNTLNSSNAAILGLLHIFIFALALSAHAANVTWSGGGSDNLASNPANWSGGALPRDDDAVIFDGTSTKNCTWDIYAIPASLSLNQGYTGTVTLNSDLPATGSVTVSDGKLLISSDLKVGFGGGTFIPSAPSSLTVYAVSSSRIDLSWTDNSNYETGFKVERKTGVEGTYSLFATVGANAAAYSDTGLTIGTSYYYRVKAYNSTGDSAYSNEANAATPVSPPTATTNAATNVAQTSAALNATVNPNGSETTVYFEWGTTASYGNTTSSISAGSGTGDVAVSSSLTGLLPGTTYHYRVAASNAAGTVYGSDMTFAIAANTITFTIDSPSNWTSINRPDVMVTGTVTNAAWYETGVTVNGVAAIVYGNQFVANHVPLQGGANTITATATDSNGTTATASITVNAVTTGNYVRLTTDTESGVSPLDATLQVDGTFSISASTLSSTGPAQPEILTSSAEQYKVRMTVEGIYYFTASVTGPDGNPYQDTVAIGVMNFAALDNLLRSKWNGMTTSLSNQDITTALTYIYFGIRTTYQEMFTAIIDQLPAMVAEQTEFNFISFEGDTAIYELVTSETGGTYSYEVVFVRDANRRMGYTGFLA